MFFIFSFGRDSKIWENKVMYEGVVYEYIRCTYNYLSFFFMPVVFSSKWFLGSSSSHQDKKVPYSVIKNLLPDNTPKISVLKRFLLLFALFLLVLTIVAAAIF